MKNIQVTKSNIINAMNLGGILENHKPNTLDGQQLVKHISENFSEYVKTINGVLWIRESLNKFAHKDNAMFEMVTKIDETLNANSFAVKLVYCHEGLEQTKNTLAQNTAKVLDELVAEPIEEAKNQIRNGALNLGLASFPYLNMVTEEAKIKLEDNQEQGAEFDVTTPITYVEESKGTLYLSIANRVYGILPSEEIIESVSPSPKFTYLTRVLENLVTYDRMDNAFVYKNEDVKVKITNENMTRFVGGKKVAVFENAGEFVKQMNFINESKNINTASKNSLNEINDALVAIKENMSSITKADNFLVIENKARQEKFAIGHVGDKFQVIVLESLRVPNIMESFTKASDARKSLLKKSGWDASSFLSESLLEENEQDEKEKAKLEAQKEVVDAIESKIEEVDTYIKEARFEQNQRRFDALVENKREFHEMLAEQKGILESMSKNLK